MSNKKNAAVYCRISTDKDDQANSLKSQREYFAEYIEKNPNWKLVNVYYDEGISGTSIKNREGFNKMINDALNGEIDLIITKEVSRFARNTVDTLNYTRLLRQNGVRVIFMNDGIDTNDSDGELRLTIMASIAQEESRKTSERVKWGQKRRMEKGVVFGRDMLGYDVKKGKMTINEDGANVVRMIFHKFVNEGKGTHVIARELHDEGIRPLRVKEWSNTVILRVLKNEKYVGDLLQKKTITPNFLSHEKKYNRGEEEMVFISNHHEPIIDRDMWDRAQEELKRRTLTAEQKAKHSNRYWCSGKLVCGECGRRMVSHKRKRQDNTNNKTWVCYSNVKNGKRKIDKFGEVIGCDNGSINDKTLVSAVAHCLKYVKINAFSLKNELLSEIKKVQNTPIEDCSKLLHSRIEALQKKKRGTIDLMLDGLITKEDFKEQIKHYDEEINLLNDRIDKENNKAREMDKQKKTIQQYIDEVERIMGYDENQTEIYQSIVDKIVVYQNHSLVVFFQNFPFGIRLSYTKSGKKEKYTSEFTFICTEPA